MMAQAFENAYICPWCLKGEVLSDGRASVQISVQCPKCSRVFIGNLDTGETTRSKARQRNERTKHKNSKGIAD